MGRYSKLGPADLEGIDWNQTAAELARQLRVSPDTVRRYAGHMGKSVAPAKPGFTGVDWSKADWSQTNSEIAQALGVTRQRVWEMRKKLEKEKS